MLLKDVKRVSRKANSSSRSAYRANGSFASETVESRFGSWTKAVRKASKVRL